MATSLVRTAALGLAVAVSLVAGPSAIPAASADSVVVRLDGEVLFRVHATDELDAATRAERIERRFQTLLDRPDAIAPAVIERGPGTDERTVRLAGATIVAVTPTDAEGELAGVDELAATWASTIDDALERGRTLRDSPLERFVSEVCSRSRPPSLVSASPRSRRCRDSWQPPSRSSSSGCWGHRAPRTVSRLPADHRRPDDRDVVHNFNTA